MGYFKQKQIHEREMEDQPHPTLEEGTKYDGGKPPLELIPTKPLLQIAEVLEFGRKKYDAHNWRKGMAWSRLYGAALRHIYASLDGVDLDSESGHDHLAHAACCLLFLLEYKTTATGTDDRYKR
jgi:hypothetical protein